MHEDEQLLTSLLEVHLKIVGLAFAFELADGCDTSGPDIKND